MSFSIRDGIPEDAQPLQAMLSEVFHATYSGVHGKARIDDLTQRWHSTERLSKDMAKAGNVFLVADADNAIIGHVFASPRENGIVWIERLYILPDSQGKGIGSALMEAALARFDKPKAIRLEVDEKNFRACGYYQSRGFVNIGRTANCNDEHGLPALIMEKLLG